MMGKPVIRVTPKALASAITVRLDMNCRVRPGACGRTALALMALRTASINWATTKNSQTPISILVTAAGETVKPERPEVSIHVQPKAWPVYKTVKQTAHTP